MTITRIVQVYDISKIITYLLIFSWYLFIQTSYKITLWNMIVSCMPLISALTFIVIRNRNEHKYNQYVVIQWILEFVGISFLIMLTGGAKSPLFVAYYILFAGIGIVWPTIVSVQFVMLFVFFYSIVTILSTNGLFKEELLSAFVLFIPSMVITYILLYSLSFGYHTERERRENLEYQIAHMKRAASRLKKTASEVAEQAHRDMMTGLYNHGYFQSELRSQMGYAFKYNEPVSLLMCDIDRFKKINDTYGHQTGDQILTQVAKIIMECVRSHDDIVARYGGEELVVILPNCNKEQAALIGERIRNSVENEKFIIDGVEHPIQVTISIGVADTFGGETPENFIKRADEALYEAKETGRNKVIISASKYRN